MRKPDPTPPDADITHGALPADLLAFRLRTAWLLMLTAAGFAAVGSAWLRALKLVSIARAVASVPLVVWWACRVMGERRAAERRYRAPAVERAPLPRSGRRSPSAPGKP